jgi:hypothetical protein
MQNKKGNAALHWRRVLIALVGETQEVKTAAGLTVAALAAATVLGFEGIACEQRLPVGLLYLTTRRNGASVVNERAALLPLSDLLN